ncbi:hypothetical protein GCM10010389_54730 [Streptomyces echinoruber]|uniref:Uncharacterized protein n=1 Tax=Streptomyces echinoruber TaxID=68898 RepID=A0A918RU58_9ACTN|nr:hypothetical protein GCM10010389_54730 [Streptomyces echinoruber]
MSSGRNRAHGDVTRPRHESITARRNPVPLPFYARYCAPQSLASGGAPVRAGDGAAGMKGACCGSQLSADFSVDFSADPDADLDADPDAGPAAQKALPGRGDRRGPRARGRRLRQVQQ